MKILTLLSLIVLSLQQSRNSTYCYEQFTLDDTKTECVGDKTCCYYEIQYMDKTFDYCYKRNNVTDFICENLTDYVSFMGGEVTLCDCFASFLFTSFFSLFIIFF